MRKKLVLTAVVTGAVLFFSVLYLKTQLKTLIVVCGEPTLNGLAILNRSNLLLINEKNIIDYLKKANPQLKSIDLQKKFPQTVILTAEERIPVAQITNSTVVTYIDDEAVLLTGKKTYPNLPKVQIPNYSISPDQKADWRIIKALSFIRETNKQGIIVDQISGDDKAGGFTVKLSSGTEILLPYDAEMNIKASSLQIIVQRFRIEGKNITKIDFRFDKPLVTLSNGEKISSSLPIQ